MSFHRFNLGNDNPILNDTLLREAYEAGQRQALSEQVSEPVPGPVTSLGDRGIRRTTTQDIDNWFMNQNFPPSYEPWLQEGPWGRSTTYEDWLWWMANPDRWPPQWRTPSTWSNPGPIPHGGEG